MNTSYKYPVDSILLLGPTGVGKSPLGDTLANNGLFGRQCHHLDFGSELRLVESFGTVSAEYSSEDLDFIHGVLERGLLLENKHFTLAEKIISLFLGRVGFSQRDVLVLNGIPRHVGQAHDIARIADIHALIVLDCSADSVFCRIRENVGGDRLDRTDDERELIEKKLSIFQERTAPLIKHFEKKGCVVYRLEISGTTTTDQAYRRLLSLAATHPPVSLVAEPPER
ncbi:MAG TPA: nucleoside monophosphate kinase [Nitrospirota bacterium]|nr:nucleoside monophosphate kinase [Nitrospirota bacterium]